MKKYLTYFKIRFIRGLQYRVAAYAGILTQFAWGFMEILAFAAFYRSNALAFPMEFSALSSYIWLQQAFLALYMLWFLDGEIFEQISSGNIAYEMVRPIHLYPLWFLKNVSLRVSKAVLRCMPILFVAFFLPKPYGLSLPTGLSPFFYFLISGTLSLWVVVAFSMFLYIFSFYTLNSTGVRLVFLSATELLTGGIIPLPFFPDRIRAALEILPFAAMQNIPLRIYSGNIAGGEMLQAMGLQVFWGVILTVGGYLWLNKILRYIVVQGG